MKGKDWIDRWKGQTVVCLASGPSLAVDDVNLVRTAAHPTIVTNTTFRMAPWADVLMAFDGKWWRHYLPEVRETFAGALLACSPDAASYGVPTLFGLKWFQHFHNSGAAAISLAVVGGASRVILLGFDCQKAPDGRAHWHPDHPGKLGNARSIVNWPTRMKNVSRFAAERRVPVVNCSRVTALKCFPRGVLKHEINPLR